MIARFQVSRPGRRLVLFFFLCPGWASAQWAPEVEGLHRFHLRAAEATVKLNVEAQTDQRTNRGAPTRRDYVFVEPVVGLDLRGSIYHPNLLEFHLKPEIGVSWQVMKLDPPDSVKWSERFLQRYDARISALREKPFATSLFAERGYTYRDLDFFSRARVDSVRYGGHTGYTAGPLPFSIDATHLAESVTGGLGRATDLNSNTFSFNASRTKRKNHTTDFSYFLNTYDRQEAEFASVSGTSHSANLRDAITWGAEDWVTLNSAALFNQLNSNTNHTRSLTLQEGLGLEFRPSLTGDGHYDFSDSRSENVASRSHDGRAALRHNLYKSLVSTIAVQGSTLESQGSGTKLASNRIGAAVEENYTKRLPAQSRLNLSGSWRGDLQRRQTAGQLLQIANEVITLSDRTPTFLNQPSVVAVGRVTNSFGLAYTETLDYLLVPHATVMEIRRVPGGNIPEGGQVLVNYTATVPPTDDYSTVTQSYQVRIELFQGLVGLYGRLNKIDNYGSKSVVLRNLADRVAGADLSWRWLRLGAERDRQDSNLAPFQSTRTYQSLAFEAGIGSTLALDCEQSRTNFPDTGRTRESRSFIGRFQKQLGSYFSTQLEGGLRRERGIGFDQDRIAARATLKYAYGKLVLNLSYEFEDEDLLGELHRRQHVLLQIKRTF